MGRQAEFANKLANDSRIAVIGGGPAGSFFAIHALDFAQRAGLALDVTIFERRDFAARGAAGCNMCAGILSSRLLRNMAVTGLTLPPEVVLGHIHAYVLHLGDAYVMVDRPDPSRDIVSVFRGGGPRGGHLPPTVSFDGYLLSEAQRRGARVVAERVSEIDCEDQARPQLKTEGRREAFDLVVLATGVNTRTIVQRGLAYVPPQTTPMTQDELLAAGDLHAARDGSTIHVFGPRQLEGLLFGGLVPKGDYLNVCLLGQLPADGIARFLASPEVSRLLAARPQRLCGCKPRIAVSMAKGFYADRFVAIGDACVTRLYKDGIGSAFLTARAAAAAVVHHGVSAASLREHFAPACHALDRDNRFGHMLFRLWERTKDNGWLGHAWMNALIGEQTLPRAERTCSHILWSMVTGDDSYEQICRLMLSTRTLGRLVSALWLTKRGARRNLRELRGTHSPQLP